MKSIPRANIYHDKRYETAEKKYFVSVRVTFCRKSKYYKTGIKLSSEAFQKSYKAKSPQGMAYQLKNEIESHLQRACEIIKCINPFSFNEFETKYYNTAYQEQGDLFMYFDKAIAEFLKNGQVSTSILYQNAKDKLKAFIGKEKLSFDGLTTDKLFKFHEWMEEDMSTTTISMYQRCIRAVFNKAIKENIILKHLNPFDKGDKIKVYKIPNVTNRKLALTAEDVNKVLEFYPLSGSVMERAKDFWLLSLYGNGINMADLLSIKNRDYKNHTITFVRKKTRLKSSQEIQIIVIEAMARIISKYRNSDTKPESLLFPILNEKDDPLRQRKAVKNFTNSVNKQMKKIAKEIGLTDKISTYFARYTFSNLAKNKGVSTEFIKESLGHTNIKTTEIYLQSFNEAIRIENTNKIFEDLKSNN